MRSFENEFIILLCLKQGRERERLRKEIMKAICDCWRREVKVTALQKKLSQKLYETYCKKLGRFVDKIDEAV